MIKNPFLAEGGQLLSYKASLRYDLPASMAVFLLAVIFAGVLQVVMGKLRAGVIGYYFPSAVITGMLLGIGLIVFLKQVPHAMGYDRDYEGDISFAQSDHYTTLIELQHMLDFIALGAIIISTVCLFY